MSDRWSGLSSIVESSTVQFKLSCKSFTVSVNRMAQWIKEIFRSFTFLRSNIDKLCAAKYIDDNSSFPIFVRQKYDWDCGIACILMILKLRQTLLVFESISRKCSEATDRSEESGVIIPNFNILDLSAVEDLLELSTPLWTIDLFVGLIDSGVTNIEMHTCCIGVAQSLHLMEWYEYHLSDDAPRVQQKFDLAKVSKIMLSDSFNFVYFGYT